MKRLRQLTQLLINWFIILAPIPWIGWVLVAKAYKTGLSQDDRAVMTGKKGFWEV